jgi:hypothetical protein
VSLRRRKIRGTRRKRRGPFDYVNISKLGGCLREPYPGNLAALLYGGET